MFNKFSKIQILFFGAILLFFQSKSAKSQIAKNYPNDSLISQDPLVVFSEMFEEDSIKTLINSSNYQTGGMLSHINFSSSVPANSKGKQSLKLTTKESSGLSNDPNEDANILKRFSIGVSDSIFIRYYIKFNSSHTFHHTGVWVGGTKAANSCWPCNIPGRTIPTNGDSAFVIGTEIRGNATKTAQNNSVFGFYNYWMEMKPFTSGPNAGHYFGNEFLSAKPSANIDMNVWNCIEIMVKLNNPITGNSGELKLWINGELISYYGEGFPNGSWSEARFIEGTGSPFEGFKWRSKSEVKFNYVWLKNYSTNNDSFPSDNDVLFDHLVLAKSYIGPISQENPTGLIHPNSPSINTPFPNPANGKINFTNLPKHLALFSSQGIEIATDLNKDYIITENLPDGIYYLKLDGYFHKVLVIH